MPTLQYGLSMTRYNRVEGFSTGLRIEQQIGGGYSIAALGRLGFADRIADWEVSLARSNASKTIQVTGTVSLYMNRPQIEVSEVEQIKVVEKK